MGDSTAALRAAPGARAAARDHRRWGGRGGKGRSQKAPQPLQAPPWAAGPAWGATVELHVRSRRSAGRGEAHGPCPTSQPPPARPRSPQRRQEGRNGTPQPLRPAPAHPAQRHLGGGGGARDRKRKRLRDEGGSGNGRHGGLHLRMGP